ncbi:MAG: tetratricopeptide repeat protein [Alphaproteobacteria bacterium]|nr:MAG: tetratricopeptide repeat protein [Alphaproteobacteria bacterium]
MALTDRFGLALTTDSPHTVESYIRAVDLMLSANAGAETLLDAALDADPDFALAHIARARLCQVQARIPEAKEAATRARDLAERVTPRERGHIETIALVIDGLGAQAMARLDAHVAEYPRDALALSPALGVFGLLGFSGRVDHHEAQLALLLRLAPQWDEDWWFLTYLGWARIETGDVGTGAHEVERALALNPHNAFAAHARAHGYYEAGDAESGAAFIEAWLPGYDRQSQLHCHLSWHRALFELACGRPEQARALYEDAIRPAVSYAPPLFNLADAASFLWRWKIYGEMPPLDDAWGEVIAHAARNFPRAGIPFADVHAALAEAASSDDAALATRITQLGELLEGGRLPQGAIVPALCAGAAAFARGDYDGATESLGIALPELARIGGSHAQREVFEDTYIAACLRAGRDDKAAERLSARLERRPSARDSGWLAKAPAR